MMLSSAFSVGLFCNDNRFACTGFKKNVFEFEILSANTSRLTPCWVCRDERTGSGALFWDYAGYCCSGLGITEYPV